MRRRRNEMLLFIIYPFVLGGVIIAMVWLWEYFKSKRDSIVETLEREI